MPKENPQKEVSRGRIVAALLDLMGDGTAYRDVSVTSLAERAGLSRRTFYRHFASVDAVLDARLRDLGASFAARATAALDAERRLGDLAFAYFSFWEQHEPLLVLLRDNELLHLTGSRFWEGARDALVADGEAAGDSSLAYLYRFMAGGMSSMLDQWVRDGFERAPRELAALADRLAEHLSVAPV